MQRVLDIVNAINTKLFELVVNLATNVGKALKYIIGKCLEMLLDILEKFW